MTIRECRSRAGKTVRQVSADLGVAERTYTRWEQGHGRPDVPNFLRLAEYFGIDPRSLDVAGREAGAVA